MDFEDNSPSPKRRRTSSGSESPYSPGEARSPRPDHVRHPQTSPRSRQLPLRRSSPHRSGRDDERRRRYSTSDSREDTPEQRRRRRSRTTESRASSRQLSDHSSRSPSPDHPSSVPTKTKRLNFAPLCTLSKAHARGITAIKFSPDTSLLATASADATIKVFSVTTDASPFPLLKTLRGHLAGVNNIAWSPNEPYILASASDDKSIMLWQPNSSDMPLARPFLGHHNYVYSLAFSPKGNMLVSGSYDEAVFLWDVRSGKPMRHLPAHSDPVRGVDFLRDGTMVCSCAGDGLIRIWDSSTGQCLKTLVDEDRKPVTSVRFTPNGQFVLAWTLDHCIRLWRYVEGTCVKTYQGHVNSQYSLTGTVGAYMAGQEAFVASGSEDGDVLTWDVSTKEILWRGQRHTQPVLAVDFCRTKDGRGLLVSAGLDRDVHVWIEVDGEGKHVQEVATSHRPRLRNGYAVEDADDEENEEAMHMPMDGIERGHGHGHDDEEEEEDGHDQLEG